MANLPPDNLGAEGASASNVVRVDFAGRANASGAQNKQAASVSPSCVEKHKAFCKMIDLGMTTVVLDARCPDVCVPAAFKNESDLRLNFSHRFELNDFGYSEEGVSATLSFPTGPFYCKVPWESVFAIQSQVTKHGTVWPKDVPKDLQMQLMSVDGEGEPGEMQAEHVPVEKPEHEQKPFLRLIKDD